MKKGIAALAAVLFLATGIDSQERAIKVRVAADNETSETSDIVEQLNAKIGSSQRYALSPRNLLRYSYY